MTVELIPLDGVPEVRPGDDLAGLLGPKLAAVPARDGDIIAVTQKVVSKAEGRLVPADDRASWIERESVATVARRGDLVITRTRHGFVCANAGVDASNVPEGFLALLPEDPDASAERLQKELVARLGLSRLAVVITDTFGRPWREGVVDVAIGCAGLPPLLDLRGTVDDRGRELETTVVALADAVAAASALVMTKSARVPAALVRGLDEMIGDAPPGPARALVRTARDDLFRESVPTALETARPTDTFAPDDLDPEALEEAIRVAATAHDRVRFVVTTSAAARRRLRAAVGADALGDAPALVLACLAVEERDRAGSLLVAGAAIGTLVVALHAHGLGWWWDPDAAFEDDRVRAALELGDAWRPIGIVAVGRAPEGGAAEPPPPAGRKGRGA